MMWLLGFLASYLTARTLHWPLLWGIALVAGFYLFATSGGAGITGAVGGIVGGVRSAVGGVLGFFRRFVTGLVVFLLLMVLLNRFTGVDLGFAAPRFKKLGVAVWGWPAHLDMAVILYLCTAFLAAGIAMQFASGNTRNAVRIVVVSFIVAFATIWMPWTVEAIRPKSSTPVVVTPPPAPATKWEDGEKAFAEQVRAAKKRGPIRRMGSFLKWMVVGDDGISSVHLPSFSSPAGRPGVVAFVPPASPVQTIIQRVGKTKQLYRFDPTGCVEKTLRSDAEFYPKGGRVIITPPPPATPWFDEPGTVNPHSALAGTFTVCVAPNSNAWGVEIWN